MIEADLEEELNDCILSLLHIPMHSNTEHEKTHEEGDLTMEIGDSLTLIGGAGMEDDVEMRELEEGGDDGEANRPEILAGLDHPTTPLAVSRGLDLQSRGRPRKYTEADMDEMAKFLVDQGLVGGTAPLHYWTKFSNQVRVSIGKPNKSLGQLTMHSKASHGQKGTGNVWHQRYLRHKEELTARAKEIESKRLLQRAGQDIAEPAGVTLQMKTSTKISDLGSNKNARSLFGSSPSSSVPLDNGFDASRLASAEPTDDTNNAHTHSAYNPNDELEFNATVDSLGEGMDRRELEDDNSSQSESSTTEDDLFTTTTARRASKVKPKRVKRQLHRYTETEKNAMAMFLVDQGLTDGIAPLSYWIIFSKQV